MPASVSQSQPANVSSARYDQAQVCINWCRAYNGTENYANECVPITVNGLVDEVVKSFGAFCRSRTRNAPTPWMRALTLLYMYRVAADWPINVRAGSLVFTLIALKVVTIHCLIAAWDAKLRLIFFAALGGYLAEAKVWQKHTFSRLAQRWGANCRKSLDFTD